MCLAGMGLFLLPGAGVSRAGVWHGGFTGMGFCPRELGRAAGWGGSQSTCQRQGWGNPVLSVAPSGGLGEGRLDVGMTSHWPLSDSWATGCPLLGFLGC